MTPQGLVIVIVVAIILVAAFLFDKKKADKARADVDVRFNGRHTVDFQNGYIADNTLVIKDRVKGYFIIDLTKVKKVGMRNQGGAAWVSFYDENGKQVDDSKKLKSMLPPDAKKILTLVCENANWIEWV